VLSASDEFISSSNSSDQAAKHKLQSLAFQQSHLSAVILRYFEYLLYFCVFAPVNPVTLTFDLSTPKTTTVSEALQALHWLPITKRITYKIATITRIELCIRNNQLTLLNLYMSPNQHDYSVQLTDFFWINLGLTLQLHLERFL